MSYKLFKFRYFLFLLLGLSAVTAQSLARNSFNCGNNCFSSDDCSNSCNNSCDNSCNDCSTSCSRDSFSCSSGCSISLNSCSSDDCSQDCASEECRSCDPRTTFIPRTLAYDSTLELSLAQYFIYHNDAACRPSWYFFATPFFMQSRRGEDFARYFLPNGQSSLVIAEDGTGDVNSLHFGIVAPQGQSFRSTVRLHPRRRTYGAYLNFWADLSSCTCEGLWGSLSLVPVGVEHRLCIEECVERDTLNNDVSGTISGFSNFTDAINNNPSHFGSLFTGRIRRAGVDDVQVKLGHDFYMTECSRLSGYIVAGIPTGRNITGRYLFEPVVGFRHHASLGFGLNGEYLMYQYCDHTLTLLADFKYRYVFAADERRSFDFCCNGPLSRFMLTTTAGENCAGQSAINLFSPCVRVEPRSTINFWTALHWEWCRFNAEFGYELWFRDCERIFLKNTCGQSKNVGLFNLAGTCRGSASASQAQISQGVNGSNGLVGDRVFTAVSNSDLLLASGANSRVITHKLYGALGYNFCLCDSPALLGVGGSYEFARHERGRGALEQWSVFAKLGLGY